MVTEGFLQAERRVRRHLLQDNYFWWAVSIGIIGCWLLASLFVTDGGSGAFAGQWQLLAWLVVIYPAIEEWLFRGLLQPQLLRRKFGDKSQWGISLANVWTTLAFVAMHLLTHTLLWAVLLIAPSLLFGWFRDRYNSILPGLILHICYNLAYFTSFGLPGQASISP